LIQVPVMPDVDMTKQFLVTPVTVGLLPKRQVSLDLILRHSSFLFLHYTF
jgi:hypothetical protein